MSSDDNGGPVDVKQEISGAGFQTAKTVFLQGKVDGGIVYLIMLNEKHGEPVISLAHRVPGAAVSPPVPIC